MQKQNLEHLIRAAGTILNDDKIVVIGSQSILAKHPDAPAELLLSVEADMFSKSNPENSDNLNIIGEASPFHEQFGYYADPVGENTAILPAGWKGRLINLKTANTNGITGLCLDPHDLVLSKYAAGREKDLAFNATVIKSGYVDRAVLDKLLSKMNIPASEKERIALKIDKAFGDANLTDTLKQWRESKKDSVTDTKKVNQG